MEERFIDANGLRFATFEEGPADGPLALLLHGFPDTPHGWAPLMAVLAKRGFRVVAPFTRGYAPTAAPPGPTSVETLAADALALIEALGHERASLLVGHDWGAATAYVAASIAPERVERLVTVGIPHPAVLKPSLSLLWAARHFISLNLPGAARRTRRRDFAAIDAYYRRWSPTWDFGPEETAPVKAAFADPASLEAAIDYYRGARGGSSANGLRGTTITMPTLTIAGADDPSVAIEAYEAARRKFTSDYTVVALPGGHFVHRESPAEFCDAVSAFLGPAQPRPTATAP